MISGPSTDTLPLPIITFTLIVVSASPLLPAITAGTAIDAVQPSVHGHAAIGKAIRTSSKAYGPLSDI
jgi:hypothetical protein